MHFLSDEALKIKILGPACINCERAALNVRKALEELNIQAEVEEVREPKRIFMHSVSSMPAVLIDEVIACEGRVPSAEEIRIWLKETDRWQKHQSSAA